MSDEVAAMDQRLKSAARALHHVHQQAGHRSVNRRWTLTSAAADDGVVPEAKAHDDLLAKHGPCGGWHRDDAATFDQAFRFESLCGCHCSDTGGLMSSVWSIHQDN